MLTLRIKELKLKANEYVCLKIENQKLKIEVIEECAELMLPLPTDVLVGLNSIYTKDVLKVYQHFKTLEGILISNLMRDNWQTLASFVAEQEYRNFE